MNKDLFSVLGDQLRHWRDRRSMSQRGLAQRLGRDRARISELERDLSGSRWGRDRLTLFAEVCDALDLVPVLVPRAQANAIREQVEGASGIDFNQPVRSAFDELFVDLGEDEGQER
ncbi:XRE family transcriptional regulator [Sphingobium indicum]|uniref:XRE family transcriptional regulator n=1 Tax=Sphingobium indicum TaxID=332055 RepID=A0A4Q4J9L6_9SPHN|nr:helix-turn-helix transcriptional regulator [Sphingobium indicum]NYI22302.1 transcriptional regulator with XRE-family HTH domain [Sphingobium indicum]RYM02982.1 XRE family transcriptional regulator [Sphingobium indicum]